MFKTGRYEIVGELGRGSMGVVYEGFDPLIHRRVAIKTMRVEGLTAREYEQYKARFQAEAQAAGVLEHPNIVTIHDFGEDNGVLYLAMEFLKGRSLRDIIDEKGILPVETVIPVFQQVSSALDHAHAHHIIHRDVKPANIMVLDSGLVKVTDFGIAKVLTTETGMTYAGQILGTPNYMSPEQVKGDRVDGRSDIFALGVILYELVTGQKPFGGQNVTTVMYKIINEQPPSPLELDPRIHLGLSHVINRALAKRPEDRYPTCRELSDDLTNYKNLVKARAAEGTVAVQRPPLREAAMPSEGVASPSRRPFPVLWAALATAVVLAAVAGGYYLRSRRNAAASPAPVSMAAAAPAETPPSPIAPTGTVSNPEAGSGTASPAGAAAGAGTAAGSPAPEASQPEPPQSKAEAQKPESKSAKSREARQVAALTAAASRRDSLAQSKDSTARSASNGRRSEPDGATASQEAALKLPPPTPQAQPAASQPSASQAAGNAPASGSSVPADTSAPGTEYVLETDPIGVDVFIDGKLWGRTDTNKPVVASLTPGEHALVLKYHGVEVLKRQIKKTTDAQWQRWKLPTTEPVP